MDFFLLMLEILGDKEFMKLTKKNKDLNTLNELLKKTNGSRSRLNSLLNLKQYQHLKKLIPNRPNASSSAITIQKYNQLKKMKSPIIKQWETRLQQITRYIMSGRIPTQKMQEDLENHKNYFTRAYEKHQVNSSWIISATYQKSSKILILKMVNGVRGGYKFFNVPFWVWVFLTTLPAHAGTQWWHRGLGVQFSSNPSRWIK